MKTAVTLIVVSLSFSAFAQSKKKVNEQLRIELESRIKMNDSLLKLRASLEGELKKKFAYLDEQRMVTSNAINYCGVYLNFIQKNEKILSGFVHNSDTIISSADADARFNKVDKASLKIPDSLCKFPPVIGLFKADSIPASWKWKAQNELLLKNLDRVDSINDLIYGANRKLQEQLERIREQNTMLLVVKSDYDDLMTKLSLKLDALAAVGYMKIKEQREAILEERRREYEKELQEEEKLRKKGRMIFIPPRIIDVYETDSIPDELPYSSKSDALSDAFENAREYRQIPEMKLTPPATEEIYKVVDEEPEFPGGMKALKEYMLANVVLPEVVKSGEVQGKVYLKFVVSTTGEVSNVKVAKGVSGCKECDAEAIRVVQGMPKWTPGKVNGKPSNTYYLLPVSFKTPQ